MSAAIRPHRDPAGHPEARLLVEDTRQRPNLLMLPVVLLLALAQAVIGLTVPGLVSHSPTAVLILTVLTVLTSAGVLMRPTTDRFEMFRAVSFYFFVAFSVAPLVLPPELLHFYRQSKAVLLTRSASLILFSYVCIAIGYHLPFFRPLPKRIPLRLDADPRRALPIAIAFLAVGVVSFFVLFIEAGGVGVIIEGQGGLARNEFFTGIGVFFWFSMFMISGGTMYFAASAARRGRHGWIHAWPLFMAFVLLITLQGRHRALGPVIMALVISNYLVRRIQLRRLAIYGLLGLTVSIVVGVVRSPSLRPLFAADPVGVSAQVLQDYPDHVRVLLADDVSRIGEIMVVVDKIPSQVPYFDGISFLQVASPFLRLAGLDRYQPLNVGYVLYPLARPEVVSDTPTGFLPSFIGEMRANFPWWLCWIPFLLFGVLLRLVYQGLIANRGDPLAVAAYSIVGLFLCNAIIGTFNQNLFEMLVVLLPVLATRMLLGEGVRRRTPDLGAGRAATEEART